jgi:hypothetical protein
MERFNERHMTRRSKLLVYEERFVIYIVMLNTEYHRSSDQERSCNVATAACVCVCVCVRACVRACVRVCVSVCLSGHITQPREERGLRQKYYIRQLS